MLRYANRLRRAEDSTLDRAPESGSTPPSAALPLTEADLRSAGVRLHQKGKWRKADILLLKTERGEPS